MGSVVDSLMVKKGKESQDLNTSPLGRHAYLPLGSNSPEDHSRRQVFRKCIWQLLNLHLTQFVCMRQTDHRAGQDPFYPLPHWTLTQGQLARCPPREDMGSHYVPVLAEQVLTE